MRIKNISRQKDNLPQVYLHTDAAQAFGKIPVDSSLLNVDYLTIVGHKFYGPRIGKKIFFLTKQLVLLAINFW